MVWVPFQGPGPAAPTAGTEGVRGGRSPARVGPHASRRGARAVPTAGVLFVTPLGRLEIPSVLLPDDCLSVSSRVINSSQEAAECHRERVRGKERRRPESGLPTLGPRTSEDTRDAGERLAPALCAPFSGLSQVGLLHPLSRKTPPGQAAPAQGPPGQESPRRGRPHCGRVAGSLRMRCQSFLRSFVSSAPATGAACAGDAVALREPGRGRAAPS